MRAATTLLNRDLDLDHFEGRRRLSDTNFYNTTYSQVPPAKGFFRIYQGPLTAAQQTALNEGAADGVTSRRRTNHILHFSVKLRGNSPENFFSASVPPGSPLLAGGPTSSTTRSTPAIKTRQPLLTRTGVSGPKAALLPVADRHECRDDAAVHAVPQPVCCGARQQPAELGGVASRPRLARLPTRHQQSGTTPLTSEPAAAPYLEMSCQREDTGAASTLLYFNSPSDLATPTAGTASSSAAPSTRSVPTLAPLP